jgi:hypothetical protein
LVAVPLTGGGALPTAATVVGAATVAVVTALLTVVVVTTLLTVVAGLGVRKEVGNGVLVLVESPQAANTKLITNKRVIAGPLAGRLNMTFKPNPFC